MSRMMIVASSAIAIASFALGAAYAHQTENVKVAQPVMKMAPALIVAHRHIIAHADTGTLVKLEPVFITARAAIQNGGQSSGRQMPTAARVSATN